MSAADDLNALLGSAVDVATDLLADATEFAPFALAMRRGDDEIVHLEPEQPDDDPETIISALEEGLREAAEQGRYRAVAIVSDVTVEDDDGELVTSAIHIAMEHAEEDAVSCVVPYTIGEAEVELGDLIAEPTERVIFPPPPAQRPN